MTPFKIFGLTLHRIAKTRQILEKERSKFWRISWNIVSKHKHVLSNFSPKISELRGGLWVRNWLCPKGGCPSEEVCPHQEILTSPTGTVNAPLLMCLYPNGIMALKYFYLNCFGTNLTKESMSKQISMFH